MGQEWAASTPFLFFTDLEPGLGQLVTEGRRREFSGFPQFSDAGARARIPDPQAASTFAASRLRREERARAPHAQVYALYRELLRLRRLEPGLGASTAVAADAEAAGDHAVVLRREGGRSALWIAVQLRGSGCVPLAAGAGPRQPELVLTTEEPAFALDPQPVRVTMQASRAVVHFARPGGAILRAPVMDR
jgi:maltooligosyltrehalose trehalohydrolase